MPMRVFALRNRDYQKFVCSSWERLFSSTSAKASRFVPHSGEATKEEIAQLEEFVSKSERLFVLTGAGISTESGIPDYRSQGVGLYATSKNRPVQYTDFLKNAEIRQRYWARNYVGWPRFSSFKPNEAHTVLSHWEHAGKINWFVQNILFFFFFKPVFCCFSRFGFMRCSRLLGYIPRVLL